MTTEQLIQVLGTQGLAVGIVIFFIIWFVRVLVPKHVQGLQNSIEEQTRTLSAQTDMIELQSAMLLAFFRSNLTEAEFDAQLAKVRSLRIKFTNGHKH